MKLLILLFLFFYMAFMLVNMSLINTEYTINLFGAGNFDIPLLFWVSVVVVILPLLLLFWYDGMNALLHYKIKKQEKEIIILKAQLFDNQKDLLNSFKHQQAEESKKLLNHQEELMKKYKELMMEQAKIVTSSQEKQKSEFESILKKMGGEEGMLNKIKSLGKK